MTDGDLPIFSQSKSTTILRGRTRRGRQPLRKMALSTQCLCPFVSRRVMSSEVKTSLEHGSLIRDSSTALGVTIMMSANLKSFVFEMTFAFLRLGIFILA
jgi:hypothetical protein